MSAPFEITKLTKDNGPLSKYIRLGEDGQPISDGSACKMSSGKAERLKCANLHVFAEAIHPMHSDQAIALGSLRPDLADEVYVVTQVRLKGWRMRMGPCPRLFACKNEGWGVS
jgi:hypothetical protein